MEAQGVGKGMDLQAQVKMGSSWQGLVVLHQQIKRCHTAGSEAEHPREVDPAVALHSNRLIRFHLIEIQVYAKLRG